MTTTRVSNQNDGRDENSDTYLIGGSLKIVSL